MLTVRTSLGLADAREKDMVAKLRSRASDNWLPIADRNGFRKLIVLSLQTGAVVALHNGDGRWVWAWEACGEPVLVLPGGCQMTACNA